MDLRLNVVDSVGGLDLEGDGLARERLHEDLLPTTKTKDEVKGRLLDVVIREIATILELFTSEDEMLLDERDTTGGSTLVT